MNSFNFLQKFRKHLTEYFLREIVVNFRKETLEEFLEKKNRGSFSKTITKGIPEGTRGRFSKGGHTKTSEEGFLQKVLKKFLEETLKGFYDEMGCEAMMQSYTRSIKVRSKQNRVYKKKPSEAQSTEVYEIAVIFIKQKPNSVVSGWPPLE